MVQLIEEGLLILRRFTDNNSALDTIISSFNKELSEIRQGLYSLDFSIQELAKPAEDNAKLEAKKDINPIFEDLYSHVHSFVTEMQQVLDDETQKILA